MFFLFSFINLRCDVIGIFGGGILRRVTIGLFPNVVTGVFNFLLDVRQEAFASRIDNAKQNNILM